MFLIRNSLFFNAYFCERTKAINREKMVSLNKQKKTDKKNHPGCVGSWLKDDMKLFYPELFAKSYLICNISQTIPDIEAMHTTNFKCVILFDDKTGQEIN